MLLHMRRAEDGNALVGYVSGCCHTAFFMPVICCGGGSRAQLNMSVSCGGDSVIPGDSAYTQRRAREFQTRAVVRGRDPPDRRRRCSNGHYIWQKSLVRPAKLGPEHLAG